jgi:hypothetical protein
MLIEDTDTVPSKMNGQDVRFCEQRAQVCSIST